MRKPAWLKTKLPGRGDFTQVRETLSELGLNTVCHEARCPNLGRCWARGTATVMILGEVCTRSCGFCSVKTGMPLPLDPDEPRRVAAAAKRLGLKYLVVTSVDRDDLDDRGASHFARTIDEVKKQGVMIEVLTPDLDGKRELIKLVVDENPDVFSHNLETVRRLTPKVRDQRSSYEKSLSTLRIAREEGEDLIMKTGIMVGLGENEDEVIETMADAKEAGVSIFTIGQYLQPTSDHLEVVEYVKPVYFNRFRQIGNELDIRVIAGPLVRSSYLAETIYEELRKRGGKRA